MPPRSLARWGWNVPLPNHAGHSPSLTGQSRQIEDLRKAICTVASTSLPIIITGETGTGKELVARCIHHHAHNGSGKFTVVSCRSQETDYEEASSSIARKSAACRLPKDQPLADTLFLEDVEALSPCRQAALARALQQPAEMPAKRSRRIIAATRSDLLSLCQRGEFLSDLYFTLGAVQLQTTPLRELRDDIPHLFQEFVTRSSITNQKAPPNDYRSILPQLLAHSWPGNVRELRNTAECFVLGLLADPFGETKRLSANSLTQQLAYCERHIITHCLAYHHGDVAATSKVLAIPKTTLYDKIHKYRIMPKTFKKDCPADSG